MSNKKRILSFFLLIFILLQFASCGLIVINKDKFEGKDPVSTESPVTTDETNDMNVVVRDHSSKINENLSTIPDEDYNGTVFKITSPDTSSIAEGSEVDVLSMAAVKRNNYVSEKHNISIVASKVDFASFYNELNAAVKSGMYYSDLIMIPQEMISTFAAGGLLTNLRSMPQLDFEADYFNQTSVGAASGGFSSYAVAGYASIYPYSLPAVFFNKELCSTAGYDPYEIVKSGEWTWDKFFEVSLSASRDTDNIFSWGTTGLGDAVYETAFVSSGGKMINSGIMEIPTLAFDAESAAIPIETIRKLYSDSNTIRSNSSSLAYFADGDGFFQIEKLAEMASLKDSKIAWGILPMPKVSADDSHRTLAGKDSLLFACPSNVSAPDKSATILMSLNAASEGDIRDGYISYVQYNYLRDNDSANMLEYIIDGTVYDFAYTYGDSYGAIADGTYNLIRQAATSDENFERLLNARKGGADRIFSIYFGVTK